MTIIGIYTITHITTGRQYVGSSINIKLRWKYHKESLRAGKHHSCLLQRAWLKYGDAAFEWIVIEQCSKEYLSEREVFWISELNPFYNTLTCQKGDRMLHHNDDCRMRMSEGQRRFWAEKRAKGIAFMSEETKTKIAQSHIGIRPSSESRLKMSLSAKRRGAQNYSPETRARMIEATRKAHIGKIVSPETKQRLRESHLGKKLPLEQRLKIGQSLRRWRNAAKEGI